MTAPWQQDVPFETTIPSDLTDQRRLDELASRIGTKRDELLSEFGKAYLAETGLHPSAIELVQVTDADCVRWFFRERKPGPGPDLPRDDYPSDLPQPEDPLPILLELAEHHFPFNTVESLRLHIMACLAAGRSVRAIETEIRARTLVPPIPPDAL